MPLPARLRRLTPAALRDDVRLRAVALAAGLIPPRAMHSEGEARLLAELARGRRSVVELGVYEGASAVVLCHALGRGATLHLVDPYTEGGTALRPGQRALPAVTRRVVGRAARRAGTQLHWHVEYSQRLARRWSEPVDLVFVDGDHSEQGCREDWELWSPSVVAGGLVLFHDARLGHPGGAGHPGPTAVVDSVFRGPGAVDGWELVAERDSLVAVRRAATR
ncbi:MAG TPA: class I SAM-dependent methyltransferase [Solirubrobacteraceae bacterium]|nr:class I SAM-dependent methyltransferase [Solirubrobacteraceae bacterium]HSD79715.1 class I SAM-dependent methyltransferase [Solirubrobacteraceae bacterium]